MMEIIINILLATFSAYIVFEFYHTFFEASQNKYKTVIIILIYVCWQVISMSTISNIHQCIRLALNILFIAAIGACFVGSVIVRIVFLIIYNVLWMLMALLSRAVYLNFGLSVDKYHYLGSFLCQLCLLFLIKLLSSLLKIELGDKYNLIKESNINFQIYSESMEKNEVAITELRKHKHDLNHKMFYLMEMIKNNENDKAISYIEELINIKPLNGSMIADTNNFSLDFLINSKYISATNQGIVFNVKINIPYGMPFDSTDLCIILGNVLDNAIEANLKEGVESPYINLNMTYDMSNLIIVVQNSFNGLMCCDRNGNIISDKADKTNHGIGLKSIRDLVAKYNGDTFIDIYDKTFKLNIILYSN